MSESVDRDRYASKSPRRLCTALLGLIAVIAASHFVVAQEPPVVSFDVRAPDNGPAAPNDITADANTKTPEPVLSFSFRFAPWESVLVKFAEVAGLTLDLTEVPPGTFNYYDKGQYSPREALDVLNGYLLQRGFVLIRRDRFLVCVSLAKGIPANLIPTITVDQLGDYGRNELVSVILSHEALDPSLAASQIEQLQGPHGNVVSLKAMNSLLVTDTGDNLRLIKRLLDQGAFSRPTTANAGTGFQSFTLQHVRAEETERLIRTLFGLPPVSSSEDVTSASGANRSTVLSITTDSRTNRLFVTASSATLASIEQIVTAHDVSDVAANGATPRGRTVTRIVPLPNADIIVIGRTLDSLSPRIRVSTTRSARQPVADGTVPERIAGEKPEEAPAVSDGPREETPSNSTPQGPNGR